MRKSMYALLAPTLASAAMAFPPPPPPPPAAPPLCVEFTSTALNLSLTNNNVYTNLNYGSDGTQADPDFAGRFVTTGTAAGTGSQLWVQQSGIAGSGTVLDPLLCTVTARTHLDNTGVPAGSDYQAGVLCMTDRTAGSVGGIGTGDGLGVRAYTVAGANGLRTFGAQGRANIEGSKEVSGGTDPNPVFNPSSPNSPPHVDELVLVTFAPASLVSTNDFFLRVTKMEAADRVDLTINLLGGGVLNYSFFGPNNSPAGMWTSYGSNVYDLNFSFLSGVLAGQAMQSFSIRALDDDPANPRGTAEHFNVLGFGCTIVPTPGAAAMIGVGMLAGLRRRR